MINTARGCLVNAGSKAAYDAELRVSHGMLPEPVELDQVSKLRPSDAGTRPQKKSRSMLLPIVGCTVVPLLLYVFMFSGWFGDEGNGEENSGGEQQAMNDTGSISQGDDTKSQPVPAETDNTTTVQSKTPKDKKQDGKSPEDKSPKDKTLASKTPSPDNGKEQPGSTPIASVDRVVDLLKLIDLEQHVEVGTWTITDGKLSTEGYTRLQIPYTPPSEYELHFNVTRKTEVHPTWLCVAFIGGGRQGLAILDHDSKGLGPISALQIDGKKVTENETTVKGALFKIGVESKVILRVLKGAARISVDGRTIIDWKGAFSRLTGGKAIGLSNADQLGMYCTSAFEFSKFELRPLSTTKPKPTTKPTPTTTPGIVNLLPKVDPEAASSAMKWTTKNGGLVSPNALTTKLPIADSVPEEYDFRFQVERLSGRGIFFVGLPVDGYQVPCYIDYSYKIAIPCTGLGTENGNSPNRRPDYYSGSVLKQSVPTDIIIAVRKGHVSIKDGAKVIYEWKGDSSRFRMNSSWTIPQKQALYIGGSQSIFRVTKLELFEPNVTSGPKPTPKVAKRQWGRFAEIRIPGVKPTLHKKDTPQWLAVKYFETHIPKFMGTGFEYLSGGDTRGNTTHFEVLSDGVVHLVLSGRPGGGGSSNGVWNVRITTPAQLAKAGWKPVGKMEIPTHPQYVIYERFCKKGESYTLSWEKYIPPRLIVPDPSYVMPELLPLPTNRLAIPSVAAQKEALTLIKEIFKKEFAAAKTPGLKLELAKKLLEQGKNSSDDATASFVLMQEARDLAIDAGHPPQVMSIIFSIALRFEIDLFIEKLNALRKLTRTVRASTGNTMMVDTAFNETKLALRSRRFDVSLDLARIASSAATKSRNRSLIKKIGDFRKNILMLKKWHEEASSASETLATAPEDPEANLRRGRFLCLIEQDWSAGLPMLAKGEDADLKAVANLDIATPTDTQQMTAIAVAWWNLAQKEKGESLRKTMLLSRAQHWYQKVAPLITGLEKIRVEKRIKEIGEVPAFSAFQGGR